MNGLIVYISFQLKEKRKRIQNNVWLSLVKHNTFMITLNWILHNIAQNKIHVPVLIVLNSSRNKVFYIVPAFAKCVHDKIEIDNNEYR